MPSLAPVRTATCKSSHLPFLSHSWQLRLWLERRSSTEDLLAAVALGEEMVISMPSATGYTQTACAGCFDETYTARTARAFAVIVCAKGRNFVSASLCRFKYGQALFDLIRHAFDFYIYFSHSSLSLFFLDCFQAASRHTCAALDAFCGIDLSCGEFMSRGRNAR